jgi:hypothetical protein
MDNPETLTTLGTQDTGQVNQQHRKLERLATRSINQSIHIQHLISTMSSTNYVYCNGHKSHLNLFLICKTKHTYPKVSRRK